MGNKTVQPQNLFTIYMHAVQYINHVRFNNNLHLAVQNKEHSPCSSRRNILTSKQRKPLNFQAFACRLANVGKKKNQPVYSVQGFGVEIHSAKHTRVIMALYCLHPLQNSNSQFDKTLFPFILQSFTHIWATQIHRKQKGNVDLVAYHT